MKWPCFILFVLGFNVAFGQFNNMSADLIMKRDVSWIKASYFEDDMSPNYQVFYAFDTIGRPVHSNSSDEILTFWTYPDSITTIKSTVNADIGNKIIEVSKDWQTRLVVIHSSAGDSVYHQIKYDTISDSGDGLIQCYDIVYPGRDTAYRQLYDFDGHLLRYEIFGKNGKITAYYTYLYANGLLDYSEYHEGEKFVYKEKVTYYEDSEMRKQRVLVSGDDMFSNELTRNVTRYLLDDDGLLVQEIEFLGTEHVSTIGYNYEKSVKETEMEKQIRKAREQAEKLTKKSE